MIKVYQFEIGNIETGENQVQRYKSTQERIERIKGRVLWETEEEVPDWSLNDGKFDLERCLKTKVGWIPKRFIISIQQSEDDPDLHEVYYVLGQSSSRRRPNRRTLRTSSPGTPLTSGETAFIRTTGFHDQH